MLNVLFVSHIIPIAGILVFSACAKHIYTKKGQVIIGVIQVWNVVGWGSSASCFSNLPAECLSIGWIITSNPHLFIIYYVFGIYEFTYFHFY